MCRQLQFTAWTHSWIVHLHQKLILKVGVVNAITNIITMNLRKQLASAKTKWAFKNMLPKLWRVLNISEHHLKHVYQMHMLAFLLTKLISIPHHIKIYLFTINIIHQRYTSWWQLVMIICSNSINWLLNHRLCYH